MTRTSLLARTALVTVLLAGGACGQPELQERDRAVEKANVVYPAFTSAREIGTQQDLSDAEDLPTFTSERERGPGQHGSTVADRRGGV
jgi:hypothetical protein